MSETMTTDKQPEALRNTLAPLINAFGEAQWQSGRGGNPPEIEAAFEAIITCAEVQHMCLHAHIAELEAHIATTKSNVDIFAEWAQKGELNERIALTLHEQEKRIAELEAQQNETRTAALCDRNYVDGMKAGWNAACGAVTQDEFNRRVEFRMSGVVEALVANPLQQSAEGALDTARLDWVIKNHAYAVSDPSIEDMYWLHLVQPDGEVAVQPSQHLTPRAAIDAAIAAQAAKGAAA